MSNINHLTIWNLIGRAKDIKSTAEAVASLTPNTGSNAYVMGVDDNDEVIFCVNPGDDDMLNEVKINTEEIVAVIYYDHSSTELPEGGYEKWEQIFIKGGKRGQKYLDKYLASCVENSIVFADVDNETKLRV